MISFAGVALALAADNSGVAFVKYYADWCPHCVRVAPIWNSAKEKWGAEGHERNVAWVNNQCYKSDGSDGAALSKCAAAHPAFFPDVRLEVTVGDKEGCVHLPDMGLECPCPYTRTSGERVKLCVFYNDAPKDAESVVQWVTKEVAHIGEQTSTESEQEGEDTEKEQQENDKKDEEKQDKNVKFHVASGKLWSQHVCYLKDAPHHEEEVHSVESKNGKHQKPLV